MPKAAALQMVSGPDRDRNLAATRELVRVAANAGADLVALPESFALMGRSEADRVCVAEVEGSGPIQAFLAETAAAHKLWLVAGTIALWNGGSRERAYASCLVYDDTGAQRARYDKIHLFDVVVPENGEQYKESANTVPGDEPVVIDTPVGKLGLAVCYDLRFPELFRQLCAQGAQIFAVPSAFAAATGRAHWEVLVRARAIENLCYVRAPGQGGRHASGRETHGDTMVVDPWGRVVDRVAIGPGVALIHIDSDGQRHTRAHFPCLRHRRL
ncbi:MAG: carbon-nitrogen hydrolase family protein [Salinisphaera sp.]|nr:carbon-nitrogen hydrolase family protein [Salinisphaera sp.]